MKGSETSSGNTLGRPLTKPSAGRKLKRWLSDYKWPLLGLIWVATIALGYVGLSNNASAIGETRTPGDILYDTLRLFVWESGAVVGPVSWELQVARFLAPLVAAYTAILALAFIFREQFQVFRLRFLKNHIVICGLGRKGLLLSRQFRERGEQVVVIEQNGENAMLALCREHGVISLIGDATNPEVLRKARVHNAKYVISVCGNDGANAEVAIHARELVSHRVNRPLSCLVHIVDLQLFNLLRVQEIIMGRHDAFRLQLFNIFESGARVLLDQYPPFSKTGGDQGSRPQIIVVGVGRLGESLIVNAARRWRDRGKTDNERLCVTMIDRESDSKKDSLCRRYPQLERYCELLSVQTDVEGSDFEQADFLVDSQKQCDITTVYVCLDNDSRALSVALM